MKKLAFQFINRLKLFIINSDRGNRTQPGSEKGNFLT